MKDKRGITLITLIITIILLLILAGITIATLTKNGLLEKAKQSQEKHISESAKEKLQMELIALNIDKQQSKEYNKNEYLNKKLEEKGFLVKDNIVVVDNYCFEIDRDKLEIVKSIGKSKNNVFLSYTVYDNQDNNNLKVKLKFYNQEGIKSIIKPDGTVIEVQGEKEVFIDYIAKYNTNENFKVILKDNTEVECNLNINENGINETFKIENNAEENEFTNIKVNYEYKEDTDKTYYKIGESGKWYKFTDDIQLDMAAIENVTDTKGNEGDTIIYIKKEDVNGNIVTLAKKVHINSTAYNVLSNIRYKGESSDKYFSFNTPYNQCYQDLLIDDYLIVDFGYGHWEGSGYYIGTYNLNYSELQLKTANKLKVTFNHHMDRGSDGVSTYTKVYYTDGTTSEEKISEYEFEERWEYYGGIEGRYSATIDLEENKKVDYIEMKITGYDSSGGDFYGIIRDIVFYGVTK